MNRGIDTSHNQVVKSWSDVSNDGVQFVFLKATQGDAYRDPTFVQNVTGAKTVGIDPKAYLFYDPTADWLEQVDNFILDLRPHNIQEVALDLEWLNDDAGREKWGQNSEQYHDQMLRAVLSKLEQAGFKIVIYTSTEFIKEFLPNSSFLGNYDLWLCHYSDKIGELPAHWTKASYWQYSQKGQVAGIEGPVDMDFYLTD